MSDARFLERVGAHVRVLYPDHPDSDALAERCVAAIGLGSLPEPGESAAAPPAPLDPVQRWGAADAILITYADSIVADTPAGAERNEAPLARLGRILRTHLRGVVSTVHLLPFFPWSSDRGFAVIDYHQVDPALGTWDDIDAIGAHFDLMTDLVCNHVSSESEWFEQFLAGEAPGRDYFVTVEPGVDTRAVVRPRATPLLHAFETAEGPRLVWCTFSADQVDLDIANPDVLCELLGVVDRYVRHGARFLRLDAIAYLAKEPGTSCVHLPRTHEFVRLLHTLLAERAPKTSIITETNVPNRENLSYFGNRNEAHLIYNFSLPPLVIDALLHGRSDHLMTWMMSMPPAPFGCTYLNFLSSHDGIGVRPAEGLLTDDQLDELVRIAHLRGGRHGTYSSARGPRPYELNITLWDLLGGLAEDGTDGSPDHWQAERFVCAHVLMFGLEGIPAVYINSLFARSNDSAGADASGIDRDISRGAIAEDDLVAIIADDRSPQGWAAGRLRQILRVRSAQPALHPNATQFTLHLGSEVFGFWRQSLDRSQSLFALHNVTDHPVAVTLTELNLIADATWVDLLGTGPIDDLHGTLTLAPYQSVWLTNAPV